MTARRRAPIRLAALALVLAHACGPLASVRAQAPAQAPDDRIDLKARLVEIDVLVRDKKGNYVRDLTRDDFTVVENGAPQSIEFLDPPGAPASPEGARTAPPRNVVSLLLDAQTTESTQFKRIAEGTNRYVRERVADTDSVAVFRIGRAGLQLVQPFTRDKTRLIAAVANGFSTEGSAAGTSVAAETREASAGVAGVQSELAGLGPAATDPNAAANAQSQGEAAAAEEAFVAQRTLAQFTKLRSVLAESQSRPVIAALAALCEAQRGIPGKKIVVLFSEGFVTASTQEWQVRRLIDVANRANVAIFIVDSSGLVADAPAGGGPVPSAPLQNMGGLTSQESRIQAHGGENVFDNIRHEGVNRGQDFLYQISGDTGGELIKNANDVSRALDRVDEQMRGRYTIGYYPTDSTFGGEFRKVKIAVRRPGLEVVARPGYYAIASDDVVPFSPSETKMLAGFDAAAAKPEIPLFAEASPVRARDGRYVVPLALEIPPSALKTERADGGRQHLALDVLGVVRDAASKPVSRLGGAFDVRLDEEQMKAVRDNNVFFRQDLDLDPGTYTVDLIVRDRLSGKTSARRVPLELPEHDAALATSGLVLSRVAVPASDPTDVLSASGAQIRPAPSHEFRAGDRLIVFFDLYNAASARVTLSLLGKDGKPAVRPTAYELKDAVAEPVPHLAFAKFVSLAGLAPGAYTAAVEARDAATGASVRREARFVVAP